MKRIWFAAGLLLAVLAGTLAHSHCLNSFTENLTVLLEQAGSSAEQNDWETAAALTQNARQQWEAKELYLHVTLRHSETDAVYAGLREVTEFIQCRESGEYSAANARLIANLELLAEAERLTLKNVF